MIKYFISIEKPSFANITNVYLYQIDESQDKYYYATIKDGNIEFTEYDKYSIKDSENLKPLFRISKHFDSRNAILQAFAESLSRFGVFPEVDNKERITAQALAEERDRELDYFKKLNTMIVERTINLTKEQTNIK